MSQLTSDPVGGGQPLMSSQATQVHGLGERMVTSDGRVFRYAKAGTSALVSGNVLQSAAEVAGNQNLAPAANVAVGATSFAVTNGATSVTANQYAGGYAIVTITPGLGQIFGISGHPAAANAASLTLTLTDEVRVALTAAATKIDLVPNPYNGVVQMPATTATGAVVGVAVYPIAAGEYGWIQRSGMAAVLTVGATVVGQNIAAPGGTAGAGLAGASDVIHMIGTMAATGATGETNAVMLALE